MTVPEMVDLLKTGGPYTALAVVMWVTRFLYLAREADKEKHDAEKQKLNERIFAVIEGQNEALARGAENQTRQSAALVQAVENQQLLIDAVKSVHPLLKGKT